jgi:phosphate-selective porin OprO/OprP
MSLEKKIGGIGRTLRQAAPSSIALAVALAAFAAGSPKPVFAADDQQLQMLEDQIRHLQAQIDALKKTQVQQAQAQADQTPGGPQPGNKPAKVYSTGAAYMYGPYRAGGNEFGLSTADGQNTIELTGRLQFDAGNYFDYHRASGNATHQLESGVDGRRIRLGVVGQFAGDFQYGLVADFGGSSDSISPYVSGAGASEIENAFISYQGFNKPDSAVPVSIDVGYIDAPIQLNEAMSSNDRLLMEAPTPEVIATEFGGGDNRSVFGFRSYKSDYYAAAYVSGPTAGAAHNFATSASASGSETEATNGEALAILGRATYQPYTDDAGTNLHVGVNGAYMANPGQTATSAAGATPAYSAQAFTLSDRAELRIDPTSLLSTGSITNVRDGGYVGGELAGQYDHFFAQGELYDYMVERFVTAAVPVAPDDNFWGGYAEASWTIGGHRSYYQGIGAYTGVAPDAPLNWKAGTWGAIEFAGRLSYTDLNDHLVAGKSSASTGGVAGGTQTTASAAINYYPYSNVKLVLEYLHTDLSKATYAAGSVTPAGARIDAVAARFQVAW